MKELTQKNLKEKLYYNESTGIFTWLEQPVDNFKSLRLRDNWNARWAGKTAGSINALGYAMIGIDYKDCLAHRLAWLYIYGTFPENLIDHVNGNRSDNRICNLRLATKSENAQNMKRANTNNKIGLLGVTFSKFAGKYVAQIMINRKKRHLGYFVNKDDAHNAYLEAKREIHSHGEL